MQNLSAGAKQFDRETGAGPFRPVGKASRSQRRGRLEPSGCAILTPVITAVEALGVKLGVSSCAWRASVELKSHFSGMAMAPVLVSSAIAVVEDIEGAGELRSGLERRRRLETGG